MGETNDNTRRGYRGIDFYALHLLCHSRLPGKLRLAHIGTADELLAARRIDKHIRFSPAEGVELDVWLIRGREQWQASPTDSSKAPEANSSAAPSDRPCPGTVLILHGLWDSKARFFRLGELLASRGFDVVLPDLRRHGDSAGGYTTFGALEKHDMLALTNSLREAGDIRGPLWVFGFSMGAAITVRYAALDPLVRGAVAAAPFADAKRITRRTVPLMSSDKFEAVWARAAEIAGFDPNDISTVEAARGLRCPLIVIHGRLDLVVPYSHGRAVFEAAPQPKRLYTVGWAGHPTLLLKGPKWLADRVEEVTAMARRILKGEPPR
jgi:pimeloyl-ACP methyl ester carboxylesterase